MCGSHFGQASDLQLHSLEECRKNLLATLGSWAEMQWATTYTIKSQSNIIWLEEVNIQLAMLHNLLFIINKLTEIRIIWCNKLKPINCLDYNYFSLHYSIIIFDILVYFWLNYSVWFIIKLVLLLVASGRIEQTNKINKLRLNIVITFNSKANSWFSLEKNWVTFKLKSGTNWYSFVCSIK